nr:immunoglobulin heavy chain junction region [Macaca mulatta]MOX37703.1 immunoglobulin heavy chain junction region [Macaca mulatta]MOX37966.1 immunoglobulin heavy chain junction region [Macaca mulatta]MOX38175.1 immunoglobulin heavy chain junction region [Macaca mulatta]MOX38921.1 immunoglobulin heavy chain junction region [Macaca mulatta]
CAREGFSSGWSGEFFDYW